MRHASPSVLCLDLGTNLGWALLSENRIISGSFKTTLHTKEAVGVRFLRFENEFLRQFRSVREVHFEDVCRHEGTHAAHVFGGFWAILNKWCVQNTIPLYAVGVGVWKKEIIGKGNATKEQVLACMKKRGFNPIDYNEADSLAILHYVCDRARKQ